LRSSVGPAMLSLFTTIFVRELLQINRCIIVANGWKRFFVFSHLYPLQLFA
jgi:hypothetical protein